VKHQELATLAQEIRHYLLTHPNAADSLRGIVRWWLARQRYEQTHENVQKALDHLVSKGLVRKTMLSTRVLIYSLEQEGSNEEGDS
jgi:hypothetical protein